MAQSERISEQLMFVSGYVYRLLIREARRIGMRWTAILVLKDLDLLGSLNQQEIADIEQVRRPTMTVLLQKMEMEGWIRRRVDSKNRSANIVSITPAGRKALQRAGEALRVRLKSALSDLSDSELADLERGLTPVGNNWMRGIATIRR
jgi:DNA-binding MarR family transcriptional regulator